MLGNYEGLSYVDDIGKRLDDLENHNRTLQADQRTLQADHRTTNARLDKLEQQNWLIFNSELLKFLPREKQPDFYKRDELVHGGKVVHHLQLVGSPQDLHQPSITQEDLEKAFEKMYGDHPSAFTGDFPGDIEYIINLRCSLMHLHKWKNLYGRRRKKLISKRDELKAQCTAAINRWFRQSPPYSADEVASTKKAISDMYNQLEQEESSRSKKWRFSLLSKK